MSDKTRLRLTSKGWTRLMASYLLGSVDFRTGAYIPDPRRPDCRVAELWVGPFPTAEEAFSYDR